MLEPNVVISSEEKAAPPPQATEEKPSLPDVGPPAPKPKKGRF